MQHFMKKSFGLLFWTFIMSISSNAQNILWEKSYGGKHDEILLDAISTPDYGYVLVGSSVSNKNGNKTDNNKGNFDYWVWKMTDKGDLDWQKSFGGDGMDILQSIKITTDGGFILAGTSSSSNEGEFAYDKKGECKGGSDLWIIKLDARGNELWQRTIGGNGQDILKSISQTTDGGFIIGGSSSSDVSPKKEDGQLDVFGKADNARGGLDYWIIKLDKSGVVEWQKTLGGIYNDELKSIIPTKDGFLVGGYSNSPESGDKTQNNIGIGDYWIVKLNTKGELLWQKTIGGNLDDHLYTLIDTKDGNFILGGNSNSEATQTKTVDNSNGTDFWVVKIDYNGSILWQQTYNYGKNDVLTSIVENPDGTLLLGGYAQSEASITSATRRGKLGGAVKGMSDKEGINDYIALKISATGEKLWEKTIGSQGDEVLTKLFEARDGSFLLAGTSNGGNSRDKNSAIGGKDFWVVKLKDMSKPEKVKVNLETFPNPAETFTNVVINFDYSEGLAKLIDINGRIIQEQKITGSHTIPVDLTNLSSGVYIINVVTNTNEESIKVIKK